MAKPNVPKTVYNTMVRVLCPRANRWAWANSSKAGPRCTSCGQTGHDKVRD